MESDLTHHFLGLGYQTEVGGGYLLSPEGSETYAIKLGARGVRDLRDATIGLATFFTRHPKVVRGYVLVSLMRISPGRVRAEWESIKRVLLPEVSTRMYLVAVVDGTEVAVPPYPRPTPVIDYFLNFAGKTRVPPESRSYFSVEYDPPVRGPLGVTWKSLEVEKVLLHRWLLREGPIAVGILSRQVGCSYPTAIQAVRWLAASELIARERSRSVALVQYPRDRWAELLRAQRLVYPPEEFVDPIPGPGAVDGIMRRLNRLRPTGVAIGGVIAARRWDPAFDLNGTPRIDVLLHTPAERSPHRGGWLRDATELVRRLDPALKRRSPQVRGVTVLVLHRTYRRDPLFLDEPKSPMPFADPVEVLCHLNELGLTAQARELVSRLRQGVK